MTIKTTHAGKIFTAIICMLLCCQQLHAQDKNGLVWYTDINEAYNISNKTQKPIFAFFTGSDWCGWCHRLQDNVFAKSHFQAWAKKNVILLELDFPHQKKLPDALQQQNNSLQQTFQVAGFPTIWIFNMAKDSINRYNIAALGTLGYPQSAHGKEEDAFLQKANDILKSQSK